MLHLQYQAKHKTPMDSLPTETLLEIFLLLAPIMATTANGFSTLALVCRRWHTIAEENHRLWTSISITLTTLEEAARWNRRLSPYLLKSGTLPLSIVVECNYRPRNEYNNIAGALFAAHFIKVLRKLATHSVRWVSLDLNIAQGIPRFEWLELNAALSVTAPRLNRLSFAGSSFRAVPILDAVNLQHIILVDLEVDEEEIVAFPQATHLHVHSSRLQTCPPTTSIATCTSLVQLTLSIWEWDEADTLEGTFPCLITLSLVGGCQLQPGLLENFFAPALEALDIGLWWVGDVRELLSCQGIPFSRLNRISFGWRAAADLCEMFSLLGGMLKQCSSLSFLELDHSASMQCELTCLLVLLLHLESVEGAAFQFSMNGITERLPSGRSRLETRDYLARKYELPSLAVDRDEYLKAMELWL